MTGSLQIKGNKYYVVTRMPDENGKSHPKWISTGLEVTGNNRREAKRIMQRILADLEAQNAVYSMEMPFLDWIDKWMEQKRQEVRLNTWESYQFYLEKHIRPYFAPKKLTLRKLTPQHLQDYYNAKLRDGQSVCTLKKHNAVIHGALQEAVKKRLLTFNPADQVTSPEQAGTLPRHRLHSGTGCAAFGGIQGRCTGTRRGPRPLLWPAQERGSGSPVV